MANQAPRILVVTAMYPHPDNPAHGIFVKDQIESLSLADPSLTVDILHLQGHRQLRYISGIARVFLATIKRRYSVVHAHYGLAGLSACFRFRTPLVITLHGSDVNIPWQRRLSRVVCLFARGIIVQSRAMHLLLKVERAQVIPVGIDMTLFRELDRSTCRNQLGLTNLMPIILFPSDPVRRVKRFDLFLSSVNIVRDLGHEFQVLTLASATYAHEQMPVVLNACNVLVLTSDTEGSPMVIKEAMACNVPIVTVDVGDVREIINGTNGCYVASRDPEDIAEKITMVLDEAHRTNGREKVLGLSQEEIASRIIKLYQEVIK